MGEGDDLGRCGAPHIMICHNIIKHVREYK